VIIWAAGGEWDMGRWGSSCGGKCERLSKEIVYIRRVVRGLRGA